MADPINLKRLRRLADAKEEAIRFIGKADVAIAALTQGDGVYWDKRATAAAKRASMDLTRALADVRRNPYDGA